MNRAETAVFFQKSGLVPLFYHSDLGVLKKVVKACFDGGARLFEFTARGDFAEELFSSLAKFVEEQCPEMLLGVGSVRDGAEASRYLSMGASFVVSPVLREDIALICNRRKIMYLPGCGTLGEICRAEELGCEIVKLFPASVYGPEFVKAVKGPQPWTSIMPSGGVSTGRENLKSWFDAGVTCVGMGSSLIKNDFESTEDELELKQKVEEVLRTISEIRK